MTVQLATSPAVREAIYRMRYAAYVGGLGHAHPHADHDAQTIHSPADEGDHVRHLNAVSDDGRLLGAVRLRLWRPGALTPAIRAYFHLDVFPEVDRYSVGEIASLVVGPTSRTDGTGRQLREAALATGVREIGMQIVLCHCPLEKVPFWFRYSLRPYCDALRPFSNGLLMPLAATPADLEYNQRCQAGSLRMLRAAVDRGIIAVGDLPALRGVFTRQSSVWIGEDARARLLGAHGDRLAELLTPEQMRRCAQMSYAVRVEPGQRIIRAGSLEGEPYFVIDGRFEVREANGDTRRVGPGELLDRSTLGGRRRRAIDAVALTTARVMVLGVEDPT